MASCKNCIHYGICEYSDLKTYATIEKLKLRCKDFKNKADITEVQHGEWKLFYEGCDFLNFHCSHCDSRLDVRFKMDIDKHKFCYNCGAKMSTKRGRV